MQPRSLAERIDHTVLRPDATRGDVRRLCEEAVQYGFGAVFVPPCFLEEEVAALRDRPIRVGVPVGFPLGSQRTRAKVCEAVEACERGAVELDMVLNIGRLKSGEYEAVEADIAEVVRATPGVGHKVILETCYLTQEEKVTACRLAVNAGADYVKTSSGFGPGGATVTDVRLLAETVAGQARVKASGGIRDLKTAVALLDAGADRLGTSASLAIMAECLAARPSGRA
ncbi:deoxyribose-phosphate aldolase [Nitrospira sp. Kam-Ns4a]